MKPIKYLSCCKYKFRAELQLHLKLNLNTKNYPWRGSKIVIIIIKFQNTYFVNKDQTCVKRIWGHCWGVVGVGRGEWRVINNKSCYQQRCASSQQKLYPTLPKRYEREAEFWPKGRELKWPLPLLAQPIPFPCSPDSAWTLRSAMLSGRGWQPFSVNSKSKYFRLCVI